jgi:hypothetical protein
MGMKKQMVETIVDRNNASVFDQRVNEYLVAGWELYGPPTHEFLLVDVRVGDSAINYRNVVEVKEIHCQTMVKTFGE